MKPLTANPSHQRRYWKRFDVLKSDNAMFSPPNHDCSLCPRLQEFRDANRQHFPDWHNAPVPSFGNDDARLLIVGLAPGLKGANRTGRPFTGDFAGELLYQALGSFGLAEGSYSPKGDDDFALIGCRITNAVRCVPPKNRPVGMEIANCNTFLKSEINGLRSLRAILALGTIAHGATLSALGEPKSTTPFHHGEIHRLRENLVLADSYHCSRLNTNTGRLTREMFEDVFRSLSAFL